MSVTADLKLTRRAMLANGAAAVAAQILPPVAVPALTTTPSIVPAPAIADLRAVACMEASMDWVLIMSSALPGRTVFRTPVAAASAPVTIVEVEGGPDQNLAALENMMTKLEGILHFSRHRIRWQDFNAANFGAMQLRDFDEKPLLAFTRDMSARGCTCWNDLIEILLQDSKALILDTIGANPQAATHSSHPITLICEQFTDLLGDAFAETRVQFLGVAQQIRTAHLARSALARTATGEGETLNFEKAASSGEIDALPAPNPITLLRLAAGRPLPALPAEEPREPTVAPLPVTTSLATLEA